MVRTQISLTEHQHAFLKEAALREGVSLSELVRQAVDELIVDRSQSSSDAARALIGALSCGDADVSVNHDRYLAETYGEEKK